MTRVVGLSSGSEVNELGQTSTLQKLAPQPGSSENGRSRRMNENSVYNDGHGVQNQYLFNGRLRPIPFQLAFLSPHPEHIGWGQGFAPMVSTVACD